MDLELQRLLEKARTVLSESKGSSSEQVALLRELTNRVEQQEKSAVPESEDENTPEDIEESFICSDIRNEDTHLNDPKISYSRSSGKWYLTGVKQHTAAHMIYKYGWYWDSRLKAFSSGSSFFVQKMSARLLDDSAIVALDAARSLERISGAVGSRHHFQAPEGFEYLPYQQAGIGAFTLTKRSGMLLGDEMGLGKTVQAAGIINNNHAIKKVLILAPAFLCINWCKELNTWLRGVRNLSIWRAKGKHWDHNANIVAMSYDSTGRWERELRAKEWDLIVCDECHYLKNPNSARTRRVFGGRIDKVDIPPIRAKKRLMLTGTPILNNPIEVLPIAKYCDPVAWGDSLSDFKDRYGSTVESAKNLRELHTRLRQSIMVRRLKKDVLKDLPPKRRQVIEVEPDHAARAAIAQENKAFDEWMKVRKEFQKIKTEESPSSSDNDYRKKLRALRQGSVAAWAALARMRKDVGIRKVPWIIAAIEEIIETGEKLIVFCHHKVVISRIAEHFKSQCVVVNGSTPVEAKNAACEDFQDSNSNVRLFIGGLKSAGVGLTLTAASVVLFGELDWTPAVLSQAEDRAHRIGQLNPVLVQHIVLAGSLDAHMSQKLIAKQEMADMGLNETVEIASEYMFRMDDDYFEKNH